MRSILTPPLPFLNNWNVCHRNLMLIFWFYCYLVHETDLDTLLKIAQITPEMKDKTLISGI